MEKIPYILLLTFQMLILIFISYLAYENIKDKEKLFNFENKLIGLINLKHDNLTYENIKDKEKLFNFENKLIGLESKIDILKNNLIKPKIEPKQIDISECNVSGYPCPVEYKKISQYVTKEIIEILKRGNNTIYLRHSKKPDNNKGAFTYQYQLDVFSIFDNNTNRPVINKNSCLSEIGKEEAYFLGKFFSDLNIPIAKIYSSPICRCKQTAKIAFGRIDKIYSFLKYASAMNINDNEKIEENYKNTKQLFFEKTSNGNKIIVGHGGVLSHIGINQHIYSSGFVIYNHEIGLVAHIELANLQYYKFLEIEKYN